MATTLSTRPLGAQDMGIMGMRPLDGLQQGLLLLHINIGERPWQLAGQPLRKLLHMAPS